MIRLIFTVFVVLQQTFFIDATSFGLFQLQGNVQFEDLNTLEFSVTVSEDWLGVIYKLQSDFAEGQSYSIVSASKDLFIVDNSGNVKLKPWTILDYEDQTQHNIVLRINATNLKTQEVTQVTLTIAVTDVNEYPEFKNDPYPYLATINTDTHANTMVYKLFAEDPDFGADIQYRIDKGSEGRFYISTEDEYIANLGRTTKVGTIYTQGDKSFEKDHEFQIVCSVVDLNSKPQQRTATTVYVKVGTRPPQLYKNVFHASIKENNAIGQTLNDDFKVQAKGFQGHLLTYELLDSKYNKKSSVFTIGTDGLINVQKVLDFEAVPKEQRPPIFKLVVIATESVTNLQSKAELNIEVLDDNDNVPIFELSRYSETHPEDLPIDATVLEVMAVDEDSGTNAELTYSVNHDHFYVDTVQRGINYVGIIRVKKRLDYDRIPGHMYSFTITASDHGVPLRTSTAHIRVIMTNVNDEHPEIILDDQKLDVREDAKVGDAVVFIQAVDLDKDRVSFYFSPNLSTYEIFEILPDSGLIRLTQLVPTDRDLYVLNITAKDDGSCCGGFPILTSEAYLIVEIVDINTHKPSFPDCSSYNDVSILENQNTGTFITKVKAIDQDRGENGRVVYSILRSSIQPREYFRIDANSGNLTSAFSFDREAQSSYSVTVQGTDNGVPPLDGYCTFRVAIGDVNDNNPAFDQVIYRARIPQNFTLAKAVLTVRADDDDLGINAQVTYDMVDNPGEYFRIEPETGIIRLNKTLGSQSNYSLVVVAKDKGTPTLTTSGHVVITVSDMNSKQPTWNSPDYDANPYVIDETEPINSVIATFSATSNVDQPEVVFKLIDNQGNPVTNLPPFEIRSSGNSVNLTVSSGMNFNVKNQYELRLRVTNQGANPMSSEIHPRISLMDTNNEIPVFRGLDTVTGYYPGSIPENAAAGQTVIEIKAYDEDPTTPNNLLTFSIVPKDGVSDKFAIQKIDANTAVLTSLVSFDREAIPYLFLTVKVQDATPSSRSGMNGRPNTADATVQITITDMNDNPPYFETTYNTSVREDAPVQQSIVTVSAKDPDDAAVLSYSITEGNVRGAFGIWAKTGIIFVGRQLDYETEAHLYNLQVNVSDGIYTNSTTVSIHLLDANDNSPVFVNSTYIITDVVEEDKSVTASNKRYLTTVSATDADKDRPTDITYSLLGFGTEEPNKYFEVEPKTGRVYLLTSLDRDLPNGRPNYQFNVKAQDEPSASSGDQPQFGFTSVQVKPLDINDNDPIFISSMEGSVAEHSAFGSSVMTILAIDYDEGQNATVHYEIVEGPSYRSGMMFTIGDRSGLIVTNAPPDGIDREITPEYTLRIRASDLGSPPRFTEGYVKINIDDTNDQTPIFEKGIYQVTMSEAQTSGPIVTVKAFDYDIGDNAQLDYSLSNHLDHFDVEVLNNEGTITVYKAVDYEDVSQRFFNLTVIVRDRMPEHRATAHVEVTVEDFNDNAPVFNNPRIEVSKFEDAPVGTSLAQFTATDEDSGINAIFSYSVDRNSDPDHMFSVSDNGTVFLRKMVDREKQAKHDVVILAIDMGDPAQTGTATLVVTVKDVNDNFPIFAQDYKPILMENGASNTTIDIFAIDIDNPRFGAPFGFAEPGCTDGSNICPCEGQPTCDAFSLRFIPSGDGGKGIAEVSTKRVFDREVQKFYYMPIVMWDMRGSGDPRAQTGTNTLTIQIGDVNDNKHKSGHQDIFIYNYKGTSGQMEIGSVYAIDPDDWDVVDKTFTFTGPTDMGKYFSVNKDSGVITMAQVVPEDGYYMFTVDVHDRLWNVTVNCSVAVVVQQLSEEVVLNSGSVRFKGISAEEFIKRPKTLGGVADAYGLSKLQKFLKLMSQKAKISIANMHIPSVQSYMKNKETYTDVHFHLDGFPRSQMNAILLLEKSEMESELGLKIDQVPIDECAEEKFEGGCYNFLNVTGRPALVNSNGTSFVGVEMFIQAIEGCRSDFYPPSDACTADYCYNGGTCSQDDWGELHCECIPGMAYNGPRCQGTHHEFDGNSQALYDPLEQCENSRTSLYFITEQEDGLILYNGPTSDRDPDSEEPSDFISLELSGGYPRLRIDHGSGVLELYVDGRNAPGIVKMQRLNDGKWHRIDIVRHGREVEMIVDHCDTAEMGAVGTVTDDMMCRRTSTTPDENKFLNVKSLLQLGGRFSAPNYPTGIMPTKLTGCVKELMHNGKLYDLTVVEGSYLSGNNGCKKEDKICGGDNPVCGENGICESSWDHDTFTCTCKPGYMGANCSEESTTKDLKSNSFIQWRLKDSFFNIVSSRKLTMHMMFRTRDEEGHLWSVSSTSNNIVIILQVLNGKLTLTYNLGDGIRNLELSNRYVSNGAWHSTVVERNGREFILKMDNGEGANFNFTYGYPADRQEMLIEKTVFAGASVSFADTLPVLASDLENSCVRDIRMNNEWFPMEYSEDVKSNAATIAKHRNVQNGCVRNDCPPDQVVCPQGQICYPLWGTRECRCSKHYHMESGNCYATNYCNSNNNCSAGSTCEADLGGQVPYKCLCPPGRAGQFCEQVGPVVGQLKFERQHYSVSVLESQVRGVVTCVRVAGQQTNVTYSLQNHLQQFKITNTLAAAYINIIKGLDYENITERSTDLIVMARQTHTVNGQTHVSTFTTVVTVKVLDVNDNYPVFDQSYHPVVMENNLNFPAVVTTIRAKDADSNPFGAPFGFRCANASLCLDFSLTFNPVMWDMSGSGDPRAQTGTNTLTIQIGDVNDNKQKPGYKDITVYTYNGGKFPLMLGNVYAEDPDDWDLEDKDFTFSEPKYLENYFRIDMRTGMITLTRLVPSQSLTFSASVTDNYWRLTVKSVITVTYKDIDSHQVAYAVPLRLKDMTAEDLIWRARGVGNVTDYKQSKYNLLQKALADRMSIKTEKVDIFSIRNNGRDTDIWISVQGQDLHGADNLNRTIFAYKQQLENLTGVIISPIANWLITKYSGGSQLVNTNATSFVGVQLPNLP